ncbi:MAG: SGNH/GDSL hydrolase family protein [Acidobacteria bacterium]|nr:SGNH/GDSL hydrolase family protein [Acidobacteriota bacterium]
MKRFLALGDSYTIGEGVAASDRWPNRLAALLRAEQVEVSDPEIVARTGWTTDELSSAIDTAAPQGPFDLVSLLVGVNDQYRGLEIEGFRRRFTTLLQRSIAFASGAPSSVVVVSIPDWGVTPFAREQRRAMLKVADEIDAFNRVVRSEVSQAGARFVDVTPISRVALNDPALLASDGLHPSASMYRLWVEQILAAARAAVVGGD